MLSISPEEARIVTKDGEKYFEVEVKVRNIGKSYAGKEIVQVYKVVT